MGDNIPTEDGIHAASVQHGDNHHGDSVQLRTNQPFAWRMNEIDESSKQQGLNRRSRKSAKQNARCALRAGHVAAQRHICIVAVRQSSK